MTHNYNSLLLLVMAMVCVPALAVKDPECVSLCETQKTMCLRSDTCRGFQFLAMICQRLCSAWSETCAYQCPDVPEAEDTAAMAPLTPVAGETDEILATVTCRSLYTSGHLMRCPVPRTTPEMPLRLVIRRKLDVFQCIKGVSYGLAPDNSHVWTSLGCSAEFYVIRVNQASTPSIQPRRRPQRRQPQRQPLYRPRPPLPMQIVALLHQQQQRQQQQQQQQQQQPSQPPHSQTHLPSQGTTATVPTPRPSQDPNSWTEWGECSATCGQGRRFRSRLEPCGQGVSAANCARERRRENEIRLCSLQQCGDQQRRPRPSQDPNAWTEWGECSATCGQGRRLRSRLELCRQGDSAANCAEEDRREYEVRLCSLQQCGEQQQPTQDLNAWTEWGECSVSCGSGRRLRSRLELCSPGVSAANCAEEDRREYEVRLCSLQQCGDQQRRPQPTQDRNSWTEWGECSVTCGQGRRYRSRLESCSPGVSAANCATERRREYEVRLCSLQQCGERDEVGDPEETDFPGASAAAAAAHGPASGSRQQLQCGRDNNNRIVGGQSAWRCQYPWMVFIYDQRGRKVCGGSIIGKRTILTAAHCVVQESEGEMVRIERERLIVFSGSSEMPLRGARPQQSPHRNYVAKVTPHPEYTSNGGQNDIAILTLRADVPDDECHRPVCLVHGDEVPQEARGCRTMGWGTTVNSRRPRPVSELRWTSLTIADDERCRAFYPRYPRSSILCAGGHGSDACSGDSGGPLVCRGEGGVFYQHGVVSVGMQLRCGELPGAYTRVSNYLSWIQANLPQ